LIVLYRVIVPINASKILPEKFDLDPVVRPSATPVEGEGAKKGL
jgi:hypothetical protein